MNTKPYPLQEIYKNHGKIINSYNKTEVKIMMISNKQRKKGRDKACYNNQPFHISPAKGAINFNSCGQNLCTFIGAFSIRKNFNSNSIYFFKTTARLGFCYIILE